ncbi:hypothetical protein [Zhenpiania hominis]|uniref:Uncharacterized protein n=1 Tax=Zhenpiania hominis TaxID=2763644 RepID=A0A923SS26_9FIRM|nr:hypothetical protein [Zhenpiania hominis]MBC6681312.1 hypothetical protein [Zhenpiania hominis]
MDILQEAQARLESFGVAVDGPAIAFIVELVKEKIRNFCNIDEVPEDLFYTAVDMVCGEYLYQMQNLGKLDAEIFPVDAAIKSISEGDVKVSFMDNASASDRLTTLIQTLRGTDQDLMAYRRLKW